MSGVPLEDGGEEGIDVGRGGRVERGGDVGRGAGRPPAVLLKVWSSDSFISVPSVLVRKATASQALPQTC